MKNKIAPDPELYEKTIIFNYPIKNDKLILYISSIAAILIFSFGIIFKLYLNYLTLSLLIIISYIICVLPYIFYKALENQRKIKITEEYISFLRSLAEALSSGMTLNQAIKHLSEIGYSELGKFIRKLYVWISWGLDFKKAFEFFNRYFEDNIEIRRANNVILEIYVSGGDLAKTLRSLADSMEEIRDIEKLRSSQMKQQVLVMYIVYLIFIGLLLGIIQVLKPLMTQIAGVTGFGITTQPMDMRMLKNILSLAIVMKAISISLISGYIESNKVLSGFKHLIITSFIAVLSLILFILPPVVSISIFSPSSGYVGGSIEINIKAYVDMKPLDKVYIDVYVTGPVIKREKVFISGGEGKYIFVPSASGIYEITVSVDYEGRRYKESRKIEIL